MTPVKRSFRRIHSMITLYRRVRRPRRTVSNDWYTLSRRGEQCSPMHPFNHSAGGHWPPRLYRPDRYGAPRSSHPTVHIHHKIETEKHRKPSCQFSILHSQISIRHKQKQENTYQCSPVLLILYSYSVLSADQSRFTVCS